MGFGLIPDFVELSLYDACVPAWVSGIQFSPIDYKK